MIHSIKIDNLRSEVRYQGYTLEEGEGTLRCTQQKRTHITRSFALSPDPSLEPLIAEYIGIMQAYFWVQGYDLCYHANDRTFELTRGKQHAGFDRHVHVTKTFAYRDYYDLDQVIMAFSGWISEANRPWQRTQYRRSRRRKRLLRIVCLGGCLLVLFALVWFLLFHIL